MYRVGILYLPLQTRVKKKSSESESNGFSSRKVPVISKFMKDIIAGRPVFGAPLEPGGFRLDMEGNCPSGLAAGSCNAASMSAMDDFIAVGTQMKIERPGKACAITPCDIARVLGLFFVMGNSNSIMIQPRSIKIDLKLHRFGIMVSWF